MFIVFISGFFNCYQSHIHVGYVYISLLKEEVQLHDGLKPVHHAVRDADEQRLSGLLLQSHSHGIILPGSEEHNQRVEGSVDGIQSGVE